jgi:hypothetical protein
LPNLTTSLLHPQQEAYTLGLAPEYYETGDDLAVAEENTRAANLELAQSAGSRYLVQRWGDGTICDMTGKNREVEVQVGETKLLIPVWYQSDIFLFRFSAAVI